MPSEPAAAPLALEPFDFDAWQAFAGATEFADGADPLIASGTFASGMHWTLVVDANGGCFASEDAQAEFAYQLQQPFANADDARAWAAAHLPQIASLADVVLAGFAPARLRAMPPADQDQALPLPPPDAADAYAEAIAEVGALLDLLRAEVRRHAQKRPADWSRVDDLAHVRAELMEVLRFVTDGIDETAICADIRRRLAQTLPGRSAASSPPDDAPSPTARPLPSPTRSRP